MSKLALLKTDVNGDVSRLYQDSFIEIRQPVSLLEAYRLGWSTSAASGSDIRLALEGASNGALLLARESGGGWVAIAISWSRCALMDMDGKRLAREDVEERWELLGPLVLWALNHENDAVSLLPRQRMTTDLIKSILRRHPHALPLLPSYVSDDEEFCLYAVTAYGSALQHVQLANRTRRVCMAAVFQSGWSVGYVPLPLQDEELMLSIVAGDDPSMVMHAHPSSLTPVICEALVRREARLLCMVPEDRRTLFLCNMAIRTCPSAMGDVPMALRTGRMRLGYLMSAAWFHRWYYAPACDDTMADYLLKILLRFARAPFVPVVIFLDLPVMIHDEVYRRLQERKKSLLSRRRNAAQVLAAFSTTRILSVL